jgi:hypothetical protein
LLIGRQDWPASSLRKLPAEEIATVMRSFFVGWSRIEWRQSPPAPGCQCLPVQAQARELAPARAAVRRLEERGVFDAGVDRVRVGERGLEMPDASELPGMRRAVVPLVRAGNAVVLELVADGIPAPAPIVGALDQLAEPAGALGGIDPVRIGRRSLQVVDLPAREERSGDVPICAALVRGQDKGTLLRTDENSNSALHSGCSPDSAVSRVDRTARPLRSHHPARSTLGRAIHERDVRSSARSTSGHGPASCRRVASGRRRARPGPTSGPKSHQVPRTQGRSGPRCRWTPSHRTKSSSSSRSS